MRRRNGSGRIVHRAQAAPGYTPPLGTIVTVPSAVSPYPVAVVDADVAFSEEPARRDYKRWLAVCGLHDAVTDHATCDAALVAARNPAIWCEDCADAQEALAVWEAARKYERRELRR